MQFLVGHTHVRFSLLLSYRYPPTAKMQTRFIVPSLFCLLLPSIGPTTGQYPCPNPEDISPCACSAREDKVYVSCFNATSSDDIFSAFNNAVWPVTNLTGFHLEHNFDVHEISERMFGDISFEGIGTDWCGVVSVRPSALMPSKDRLEYISMNRGVLEQFPWDYMQHATKLVAIDFKHVTTKKCVTTCAEPQSGETRSYWQSNNHARGWLVHAELEGY
ncbi:unnamed protein product [Darwinula stevensoni]|uniref:Uncharacterized protein n=1 Tax=Darwinula stevensoni TaxID=69355 RepID=A0A7R9A4M7_9CRUS|nr:unnamed protein product [Darwinula stevensoni]CAG0893880.1 unnamed protein product [Darwinula stevensoni]